MEYEWLTKDRRRVHLQVFRYGRKIYGGIATRMIYPPKKDEVYPYIVYRKARRTVIPTDSGIYDCSVYL